MKASGPCHECAPKDWRKVPDVSGDYDLDASILNHEPNPRMEAKIAMYTRGNSYGPKTAYNGYSGYSKDD